MSSLGQWQSQLRGLSPSELCLYITIDCCFVVVVALIFPRKPGWISEAGVFQNGQNSGISAHLGEISHARRESEHWLNRRSDKEGFPYCRSRKPPTSLPLFWVPFGSFCFCHNASSTHPLPGMEVTIGTFLRVTSQPAPLPAGSCNQALASQVPFKGFLYLLGSGARKGWSCLASAQGLETRWEIGIVKLPSGNGKMIELGGQGLIFALCIVYRIANERTRQA